MRFLSGKGFVYRLATDATRKGDFQKAALLFKEININKPFNGSAMNSPPTPPSFTFYIFQIEIYGGNLSEEIEYKGNYFLNLSLISEHFARSVFPNKLMAF